MDHGTSLLIVRNADSYAAVTRGSKQTNWTSSNDGSAAKNRPTSATAIVTALSTG